MNEPFCAQNLILIKWLGQGAFGEVYQVYDRNLVRQVAIKIAHSQTAEKLDQEIQIIRQLSQLSIPNVTKYLGEGYCSLLGNKRYYEMDLQDENFDKFIQNGNKLQPEELWGIFFELIFTLMKFREVQFKHRDISEFNVLFRINSQSRIYQLPSGKSVIIKSIIQPIISDFNTSIFEPLILEDPNELNDTLAILELIIKLSEIANLSEEQIDQLQSLINKFENDNLSPEFLGEFLENFTNLK